MLHIIWMIIKIILLILAAVLGLVLLVLAVLLFVPIRYEAHIKKKEEFFVEAKVHWLLHLVRMPVSFRDGELSAKVKVLCFTVKDLLADEDEIRDGVKEVFEDTEEDVDRAAEQVEKEPVKANTQPNEKSVANSSKKKEKEEKTKCDKDFKSMAESEVRSLPVKTKETRKRQNSLGFIQRISTFLKMLLGFCKAIWRYLSSIPKKLKNLKYTCHQFYVKIKRIQRFLTDDRTRAALRHAWGELGYLLARLLPKKVRGDLHFGTDDPALTGQILGGISIFYPLFMDHVKVVPDFEETVLEGELYLKGRIRLATMARIAWRLYRDKNVRFVYRMVT